MPNGEQWDFGASQEALSSASLGGGVPTRTQFSHPLDAESEATLKLSIQRMRPDLGLDVFFSGSDGSDSDVVIDGTTTLTRDMFYKNLTIASIGTLNTASFRVFVQETFTKNLGGIVRNNGSTGGVGTNGNNPGSTAAAGGTAGTAVASGSLPTGLAGVAGGNGGIGNPSSGNGANGGNGADAAKSLGAAGSAGGNGGNSSGTAGTGGTAGTQTGTVFNPPSSFLSSYQLMDYQPSITLQTISASGGGGGGGGGSFGGGANGAGGGAGGGSGSNGGIVWISAKKMVIHGTGEIQARGGAGGAGGNGANVQGTSSAGGGGGGGAGGSGGAIILIYGEKEGNGTLSVSAGAAGALGVRGTGGGGEDGLAGTAGLTGKTYEVLLQ